MERRAFVRDIARMVAASEHSVYLERQARNKPDSVDASESSSSASRQKAKRSWSFGTLSEMQATWRDGYSDRVEIRQRRLRSTAYFGQRLARQNLT